MPQKSLLDSVEVASPCSENWNEMQGNETVRFCSHCAKNVHNLSAMTRKRARKIVAASKGNLCVRYTRRSDGRIQTVGNKLHQIGGRASRLTAGIFGISLALTNAAQAQKQQTVIMGIAQNLPAQHISIEPLELIDDTMSQMSITVVDPNDAVIAGTQVILTNQKTSRKFTRTTDDNGIALFINLERGSYEIEVEGAPGFQKLTGRYVEIQNAIEPNLKLALNVGATTGVIVTADYEFSLLRAVAQNKIEEVQRLIALGAKIDVKDSSYDGRMALHVAVEVGNIEIVRILLDAGAKVNSKTKLKETPLLLINKNATPKLVQLLVERGANVNAQDYEGETALSKAANEDLLDIIKALLEAGANPNLKDKDGLTALNKTSDEEIEKLLVSYGAIEGTVPK